MVALSTARNETAMVELSTALSARGHPPQSSSIMCHQ